MLGSNPNAWPSWKSNRSNQKQGKETNLKTKQLCGFAIVTVLHKRNQSVIVTHVIKATQCPSALLKKDLNSDKIWIKHTRVGNTALKPQPYTSTNCSLFPHVLLLFFIDRFSLFDLFVEEHTTKNPLCSFGGMRTCTTSSLHWKEMPSEKMWINSYDWSPQGSHSTCQFPGVFTVSN